MKRETIFAKKIYMEIVTSTLYFFLSFTMSNRKFKEILSKSTYFVFLSLINIIQQ